jgi:hypothetical protein
VNAPPTTARRPSGWALYRAFRRPVLALPLYLPGALIGLLASLLLQRGLERYSRSGPWVGQLASVDWPGALVELLGPRAAVEALGEPVSPELVGLGLTALSSLATLALGLLVHGLLYSGFSGGLLAVLRDEPGSFWAHCRRRFWPQARLGLLGLALLGLVVGLGIGLLVAFPPRQLRTLLLAVGALAALLLVLNGLLELARAALVARPDRRARSALVRSLQLFRQPGLLLAALLLWLALALLGLVLAVAGVAVHLANLAPLPTSLGFQIIAFAGAWLKLLRLAVAVDLGGALNLASGRPPGAPPLV